MPVQRTPDLTSSESHDQLIRRSPEHRENLWRMPGTPWGRGGLMSPVSMDQSDFNFSSWILIPSRRRALGFLREGMLCHSAIPARRSRTLWLQGLELWGVLDELWVQSSVALEGFLTCCLFSLRSTQNPNPGSPTPSPENGGI